MKKILLRCTVGVSLLMLSVFSAETRNVPEGPVSQYVKEHVMPVMMQKRQEFDLKLNETERAELADYRDELAQLHKDMHTGWNRWAGGTQENTAPVSDEERQANFKKMHEIMAQVQNIADRHKDELDDIFNTLAPQRDQWKQDISNIMIARKEERAANYSSYTTSPSDKPAEVNSSKEETSVNPTGMRFGFGHDVWGMVNKHSRTMFLLLNPSNVTSMSNERQAPLQNISSMNEEGATIYPNPAATQFSLNIPGVTTVDKMVITDMTGKMLVDKENVSPTETFSCGNLADGVYLIQLYAGGQASTQKLIVSH